MVGYLEDDIGLYDDDETTVTTDPQTQITPVEPVEPIKTYGGLVDDIGLYEETKQPEVKGVEKAPTIAGAVGGVVKDIGVQAAKSVIGLGEAAVGLADIPTFGYAGKLLEKAGFDPQEAHATLAEYYSDLGKKSTKGVEEAEGFYSTLKAMAENPYAVGLMGAESVPLMFAGGGIANKLTKAFPKLQPYLAAAIGEGIVSAGAAAESTRQQTDTGTLSPKQVGLSLASGVGTGFISAAGGKLAQKMGFDDIDTMIAKMGGSGNERNMITNIVAGGISEGLFEELPQSLQETILGNAALDKPLLEGVGKAGATGAVIGAAMGGAGGFVAKAGGKRTKPKEPPPASDELQDILDIVGEEEQELTNLYKEEAEAIDSGYPISVQVDGQDVEITQGEPIEGDLLEADVPAPEEAPIDLEGRQITSEERLPAIREEGGPAIERAFLPEDLQPDIPEVAGLLPEEQKKLPAPEPGLLPVPPTDVGPEGEGQFGPMRREPIVQEPGAPMEMGVLAKGEDPKAYSVRELRGMAEERDLNMPKQMVKKTDMINFIKENVYDNQNKERLGGTEPQGQEIGRPVQEPLTGREEIGRGGDVQTYETAKEVVDAAANEAATSPQNELAEPTEAQKEVGNYKKGSINIDGMQISIENPKGSTRQGVDRQGKAWSQKMKSHYGYIRRTIGGENEQLDIFVGDKPESGKVYVVEQADPKTGKFDEHKVMMGFTSEQSARAGYLANYGKGWKGLKSVKEMTMPEFKKWARSDAASKAFKPMKVRTRETTTKVQPVAQKGTKLDIIQRAVGKLQSKIEHKGAKVEVLSNTSDLKEKSPSTHKALVKEGYENRLKGVYDPNTKTLYLFSDKHNTVRDAIVTAFHELGHFSLHDLMGKDVEPLLKTIAEKYDMEITDGDYRAAEERLIDEFLSKRDMSLVKKVIEAVRRFARSIGITDGQLLDSDIENLIKAMNKNLKEGVADPVIQKRVKEITAKRHQATLEDAGNARLKYRLDKEKWTADQDKEEFGTVNNRLSKELEVFETLFGPSQYAQMLPGKLDEKGKRAPTRTIFAHNLGKELFRLKKDGTLKRYLDPKVKASTLADERGLEGAARKKFMSELAELRSGPMYLELDEKGKPVLSNNGKAGMSADFLLATCQPTTPCKECYAASAMIRMSNVRKAFRNTCYIIAAPKSWAARVAMEAQKVKQTKLPFIRLLGSGDLTSSEQVEAFNELAKRADRPIQIFSRHHDNLRKLKGTEKAPFIKMGSIDSDLYKHYGHKYLKENTDKYGIANAWLLTDEADIPAINKLEKDNALGLVLAADVKLHNKLDADVRRSSCPCDADERSYLASCRQCALSEAGCFMPFASKGFDTKGKIWDLQDPNLPEDVKPFTVFMHDMPYDENRPVKIQAYSIVAADITQKSIELINLNKSGFLKGEKKQIALKDIRFPEDVIYVDTVEAADTYIDNLKKIKEEALKGTFVLPGGEIQPAIEAEGFKLKYRADDTFYSALEQGVSNLKQEVAPASQWKGMVKKLAVKQEELDWVGLEDWLDEQKGKVSKQDILDFIRANNVQVQDVMKGERNVDINEIDTPTLRQWFEDEFGFDGEDRTRAELIEDLESADVTSDRPEIGVLSETKYHDYQMPGGENYREWFLTAPEIEGYSWKDGHSEYPDVENPIVRVRFNERTGPNGEKILFIEEIQGPQKNQLPNMPKWARDQSRQRLLGIKKMVRYAAENGFDTIAWTPGEVQAERYDLSKQVDRVSYFKRDNGEYTIKMIPKNGSDWKTAGTFPEDKLAEVVGKGLAEKIVNDKGKEVRGHPEKYFSGLDLKAGGEGLASIYDKLLVNEVNKFFNKPAWGKAKVGIANIGYYNKGAIEVWSLPLTAEMQNKARTEGLPLYRTDTDTQEFKDFFGKSKVTVDGKAGSEPLVVYHGTPEGAIDAFDRSKILRGLGFHFTLSKRTAAEYGNSVIPAYVRAENSLRLDTKKGELEWDLAKQIMRDKGLSMVDALKSMGYDSVLKYGPLQRGGEIELFDSAQIKSIFNRGTWDTNDPRLLYRTDEEAISNDESAIKEHMREKMKALTAWLADKNRPIAEVQKKLKEVREETDVFLRETQRPKIAAARTEMVWTKYVEPMLEFMAEKNIMLADLEEYAHAKHAPEANNILKQANAKRFLEEIANTLRSKDIKEKMKDYTWPAEFYSLLKNTLAAHGNDPKIADIKRRWDDFSSRPSGITNDDAKKITDKYKGNTDIEQARLMLADINEARINILHRMGAISKEEYNSMKKKYQFYVPLYREGFEGDTPTSGTGIGIQAGGKAIKTRIGSTRAVVDILAHSIGNLQNAVMRATKAESARALYKLVKDNPNSDIWKMTEVKKTPRVDEAGNIKMYPNALEVGPNQIRIMVDGKQHLIEFNDRDPDVKRMLKTLKGEGSAPSGWVMETLSKFNRYLAMINTSLSPEFILSNFVRDLPTGVINLNDTGVKGKAMVRGAMEGIRAMWAVERGKATGTPMENMVKRFKKAGGKIGWADVHQTAEQLSKKISKELGMKAGRRPIQANIKKWFELIENANTSVENGIRVHVFRLAVEQGMSDLKAAQIASDITVDFTKKGYAGPVINSLYLFSNAGIQGSYRIIRAAVKSPKVRGIIGGIFGTGFLVGLLNASLGGEDEDGEDYFNKIEDHIRERNMIFMLPGTKGKYIKIPMPWGYNVPWALGSEMSRMFTKKDYSPLKGAARMVSTAFDAFNPIQSGTLLQTLSPTISDPFVMVGENKNWFGGPLMPEPNPFDKTPPPDSQRYWKSTSSASRWVANALNSLTGGNKVAPGAMDVSPETLDLLVDTFGGSAFKFFKDNMKLGGKVLKQDEIQFHEIPFWRKVAGAKSEWADQTSYFDNADKVNYAEEQLEVYKGSPQYAKLKAKLGRMAALKPALDSTEKTLRKLRKTKKKYEASGNEEALKKIQEQIERHYINFNKRFYNGL